MDRSSFLKSLFALVASPKMLAEMKKRPKPVINAGIFNDLRFVIPEATPALLAKYNDMNFLQVMDDLGNNTSYPIAHFECFEIQDNARDIS